MTIKYNGHTFLSDEDLKVHLLGIWPCIELQNPDLKEKFQKETGRDFLGGDELISYAQSLVSRGMNLAELEEEIKRDMEDPTKGGVKETVFKKTSTGIGRGHSLGGLSGVVFGISGTKMIDSGLTGLVASRSLVTSSRRRETTAEEIVIPAAFVNREELLKEYLKTSCEVFDLAAQFKEKFKKLGGIETFNKLIPYNNPADLFIVMPLDTLATLAFEVDYDRKNSHGRFIPREIHSLVDQIEDKVEQAGMDIMFEQRRKVPRDTYFHYTVFKDPSLKSSALEEAEMRGMPLEPLVIDSSSRFTSEFLKQFEKLRSLAEKNMQISEPEELAEKALHYMYALRNFVGEYNENVRVKILDSLSWRVWSEQKRHATLRQNVESVYSASERASRKMQELWPSIKEIYEKHSKDSSVDLGNMIEKLEEVMIIDDRMKKQPELLVPYVYFTAKQLDLFRRITDSGISARDALYIVPKNIRVRTLEHYDLINLIDLEFPLRLCNTCEPERKASSWKKREAIAKVLPELDYLLYPKCSVGFCTEGNYCGHITNRRKYNQELHEQTKKSMLSRD